MDTAVLFVEDSNVPSTPELRRTEVAPAGDGIIAKGLGFVKLIKMKQTAFRYKLKAFFGVYFFHFELLTFEFIEVFMQFRYMFSTVLLVPYNEWLLVMCWLVFALMATIFSIFFRRIREQPWSLKLLYSIEAISDLVYLWFNLYSLQYLTARSLSGNIPTVSVTNQTMLRMQVCPLLPSPLLLSSLFSLTLVPLLSDYVPSSLTLSSLTLSSLLPPSFLPSYLFPSYL